MFPSVGSQFVLSSVIGSSFVTLSDFAIDRLQLISVFLLGMTVSTLVVRSIWNSFRQDFSTLPEFDFRKAFTLVSLWGLLFVVVLTMISGAWELMSPGAWITKGNTYVLKEDSQTSALNSYDAATLNRRQQHLELVYSVLAEEFLQHESLPTELDEDVLPGRLREVPDTFGLDYVYVSSLFASTQTQAILAEPEFFTDGRLVLWQDGTIELIPPEQSMPYEQGGRR